MSRPWLCQLRYPMRSGGDLCVWCHQGEKAKAARLVGEKAENVNDDCVPEEVAGVR